MHFMCDNMVDYKLWKICAIKIEQIIPITPLASDRVSESAADVHNCQFCAVSAGRQADQS